MKEQLLDKVEAILLQAEEFYVPAKNVWATLEGLGSGGSLSFESFIGLVQSDKRFYLIERSGNKDNFGLGPLLGLSERIPTKQEIKELLIKKTDNILSALQDAYKVRPENSQTEADLLEIMIKAKRIKENIDKAFGDENG